MALLIRSTGQEQRVIPRDGKHFTLQEMQGYVGGDIEMVSLPGGRTLVCNEEGKLKSLPYNEQGTILGRFAGTASDDYVVGDVLVCDERELED